MRRFYIPLVLLVLISCSDDEEVTPPPTEVSAPAVGSIAVDDITNNGNASDIEVSFPKVSDETLITAYRIIVAKSSVSLNLEIAEALSSERYEQIVKNGRSIQTTLSETLLDSDGDPIENGNSYRIYVLSVADGENAILSTLSVASSVLSLAVTTIKITYIGNDGVYISDGDKAVIIDALPGNLNGWNPVATGVQSQIENGSDPFNNVSVAMVTHAHGDHMSTSSINTFLNRNSSASFLAPPQVRGNSIIGTQVEDLDLEMDTQVDVEIDGIPIKVLRIRHFNPLDGTDFATTTESYAFLITLGGVKILHIGDGDLSTVNFSNLGLTQEAIDVVLIPTFNFSGQLNTANRDVLNDHIAPREIIGLHLASATATSDVTNLYPDAIVFRNSLQFVRL